MAMKIIKLLYLKGPRCRVDLLIALSPKAFQIAKHIRNSSPPSKLILRIHTLRRQRHIKQFRLSSNDHPPLSRKPKISRRRPQENLANECSRGIPDMDPVAAAGVYIAPGVAVDAVGEAGGGVCECFAVLEGAV
jgi:hypothetical protein